MALLGDLSYLTHFKSAGRASKEADKEIQPMLPWAITSTGADNGKFPF